MKKLITQNLDSGTAVSISITGWNGALKAVPYIKTRTPRHPYKTYWVIHHRPMS